MVVSFDELLDKKVSFFFSECAISFFLQIFVSAVHTYYFRQCSLIILQNKEFVFVFPHFGLWNLQKNPGLRN